MTPAFFALATIICLSVSMAGRFLILMLTGYYVGVEWHWTGALRKRQWRYIGGCLSWDSWNHGDGHTVSNCVLGFYPIGWRWFYRGEPDECGFTGWCFGPVCYSTATYC